MRKLWQTSKVKTGEESIKLMKSLTQKELTVNAYICIQRRGRGGLGGGGVVEKSDIRYVRTKWMAPDKCCGTFFVHWSGQEH